MKPSFDDGMNSINRSALNPPESPRAIIVPSLRAPLAAVLSHFKRDRWLTKQQEAQAARLVKEYDELNKMLQSDPRADGDVAFTEQQAAIGAGKGAPDAWTRQELREEAFTRVHAARARLIAITDEVGAMLGPVKAEAEKLCLQMADSLEGSEKTFAESIGIPFAQASLTVQVLRDIPRRMTKLIPVRGVNGNVRAMLQPFMDFDPIVLRQAHDVRLDEKQEHAKTLSQKIREALKLQPKQRADEIANAAKERRKRELAKQGVVKLGSGKPDPAWAALHGPDLPLAPTADDSTPVVPPAPQPPLPKS